MASLPEVLTSTELSILLTTTVLSSAERVHLQALVELAILLQQQVLRQLQAHRLGLPNNKLTRGVPVNYRLCYQPKHIHTAVRELQVELFQYFVEPERLDNEGFWLELTAQYQQVQQFALQYHYRIRLLVNGLSVG